MSEIHMISPDSLEFDPRLEAVTPVPELIEGLRKEAKGEKKAKQLEKADVLDAEWMSFVQSVSNNGVRDALKIRTQNGKLLVMDGRHRLLAARAAEIEEVPCVYPDTDYSCENADEDDRSIILDSENRRHLSQGALAYRAVLLYPEVALNAKDRQKSGKKSEPSAMNAEGLALRIGVGKRLMESASALYRLFHEHLTLKQNHEKTVWTCSNIVKLLKNMEDFVKLHKKTGKYKYEQKKKTKAELEAEKVIIQRTIPKERVQAMRAYSSEIAENWEVLEEDDLKHIKLNFHDFLEHLPDGLKTIAVEFFDREGSDE